MRRKFMLHRLRSFFRGTKTKAARSGSKTRRLSSTSSSSSSSRSSNRCVLRLASSSMERRDVLKVISEMQQQEGAIPTAEPTGAGAAGAGAAAAAALPRETRTAKVAACSTPDDSANALGPSSHIHSAPRFLSKPSKDLRIYAVTWNMNGQVPLDAFAKLLDEGQGWYDVYVVGLQEAPSYSMRRMLLDFLGKQYNSVAKALMGSLQLYVFARSTLLPHISGKAVDKVRFNGFGGVVGRQKGAVAASIHIGSSSFLFIASHFAAHENNLRTRNFQYLRTRKKIFSGTVAKSCPNNGSSDNKELECGNDLSGGAGDGDLVDESDVVIWLGDLNYRIEGSRKLVKSYLKYDLEKLLWKRDQLFNEVDKGQVFSGFVEGPLVFKPTYKYDIGTDNYDTTKERVPSWTDRILIKVKDASSLNLDVVNYDSIDSLRISDHRPVKALLHFRNLK